MLYMLCQFVRFVRLLLLLLKMKSKQKSDARAQNNNNNNNNEHKWWKWNDTHTLTVALTWTNLILFIYIFIHIHIYIYLYIFFFKLNIICFLRYVQLSWWLPSVASCSTSTSTSLSMSLPALASLFYNNFSSFFIPERASCVLSFVFLLATPRDALILGQRALVENSKSFRLVVSLSLSLLLLSSEIVRWIVVEQSKQSAQSYIEIEIANCKLELKLIFEIVIVIVIGKQKS